jgi:outer membrane protein insertion porin family
VMDADSIVARLRDAGHPRADVFPAADTHGETHRAEVEFDVHPGPLAHFGTIAIERAGANGPPSIDSAVVLRLLGFRTGQRYNTNALDAAQRNLYNVGAYRHVGISLDTTWQHGDSVADVLVDVREDLMHQIDLEEGWATLDCFRINGQYTDKNFNDQALHLELTTRLSKLGYGSPADSRFTRNNLCYRSEMDRDSIGSSKVNDYFGATIRQPSVFGTRWSPAYSVYTERRGAYKAYLRSTDFGFGVSATREIGPATPFSLGYTFEHGQTTAPTAILCGIFNRCEASELEEVQRRLPFGVASASVQKSTTDSPVSPTQGYVAEIEVRTSSAALVSDPTLSFFKTTVDGSWYHALSRSIVFAGRARGGFIRGGTSSSGATLPPPQERLYAGGATSVRGFQQNELGPQVYLLDRDAIDSTALSDSTFILTSNGKRPARLIPGGGNALVVLNSELRIRDPFFPNVLEYVPFIDAGQVWITQAGKSQLNLSQLLVTPGVAFRASSPVGPIQLNVGYNRYPPRPGAAYFPVPVNLQNNQAPLLCVTPAGVAPLVVTRRANGQLFQDISSCPSAYAPPPATGFLGRLAFTLSISSDF